MDIPASPLNANLAHAVNRRIASDGKMVAAQAALWRCGGLGLLCLLAGAGVGIGLYGYSYVTDGRTSVDKMADAFASAISRTTLPVHLDTEGAAVRLDAGGAVVRLDAAGSAVRLDPNATVHLAPNASVRVAGSVGSEAPRPAAEQYKPGARPASAQPVVTDYTVFKTVGFGAGSVVTGWKFASSDQPVPAYQYCQYQRNVEDGVIEVLSLAVNGKTVDTAFKTKDLDGTAALANCVWFRQ